MKKKFIVILTVVTVLIGLIILNYAAGGKDLYFGNPGNVLNQVESVKEKYN